MNFMPNFKTSVFCYFLLSCAKLLASPLFIPSSAPLFHAERQQLVFKDSLEPLFGNLAAPGKFRTTDAVVPVMRTTLELTSLAKKVEVEVTRIFGEFGKSCRGPKLRIDLLPQVDGKEIEFALGTRTFFLAFPCYTVENLSSLASTNLNEAAREVLYEHLNHSIMGFYGLPRLATTLARIKIPQLFGKDRKLSALIVENAEDIARRHQLRLKEERFQTRNSNLVERLSVQSAIQNHLIVSHDTYSHIEETKQNNYALKGKNFFLLHEDNGDAGFLVFFDLSVAGFADNLYQFSTSSFSSLAEQKSIDVACELAEHMNSRIQSQPSLAFKHIADKKLRKAVDAKMALFSKGISRFVEDKCHH